MKKKELNDRKWSLLYRGSRDGFGAFDFHSNCDHKPNTLTIVKSLNGNIFGGFASVEWKSSTSLDIDKSAFIFSLVNKDNRTLIFEQSSSDKYSICSYKDLGPIFGVGHEFAISNSSNTNTNSISNLGYTYSHQDYPFGSEKAKTILGGSRYFQVLEIEVFQMQQ